MAQQATETINPPQKSLLDKAVDFLKTCDRGWLWLTILATLGIGAAFWPLIKELPLMWLGLGTWEDRTGDGYYSHGLLVPLISGYIIYRQWPSIKDIKVKPGWIALVPLAFILWILWAADAVDIQQIRSISLVTVMMLVVWLVAGARWMFALAPAILYLLFALPVFTGFIDTYTNDLQIVSTKVAAVILDGIGYSIYQSQPTEILMDNFDLNVAVPCSGLKLLVAVSAFTVFFMLIAKLKWWANALMVAIVLPLCLFINGLRIALIGIVGEENGATAGLAFHDYSGYITLLVCFFVLFKFAKVLGWKD
ncbi:MAG: exosortase/archaeosortase family protein [Fimbriimonadaceae bacterium]